MTTPAGVPNLPAGALTVQTLGDRLQNHTPGAMRQRAREQMPQIFDNSTGGNILSDLSPFGILTGIWAGINSLLAQSDPADVNGPEDLPQLFIDFIEELPVVGQFVKLFTLLLDIINGNYDGDDELAIALQDLIAPLFGFLTDIFEGFITTGGSFLKAVFTFIDWAWNGDGTPGGWGGFGSIVESVLKPIIEVLTDVFTLIGRTVLEAIAALLKSISDLINIDFLRSLIEDIAEFLGAILNPARFADIVKAIFAFFGNVFAGIPSVSDILNGLTAFVRGLIIFFTGQGADDSDVTLAKIQTSITRFLESIPLIGPLIRIFTGGETTADGSPITDLGGLGRWVEEKIQRTDKPLDAGNLRGRAPGSLFNFLPFGNVTDNYTPNLIHNDGFPDAGVMQQGGIWSWDGSVGRSGDGAAKVTCNSANSYLYSNKVDVNPGQLLKLSAWIKWSGVNNTSLFVSPISIGLRTYYQGQIAQTNLKVASVATIGFAGTVNSWTELSNVMEWQVPPNVDQVRMTIGVNNSATQGTVWFDDISLKKRTVTGANELWNGFFRTSGASGKSYFDLDAGARATREVADTGAFNADQALLGASGAQATANAAASGASGANAGVQATVDGVNAGIAITGTGPGQGASSVLTAFQQFNNWLFGGTASRPGESFASGRIPDLDGSIIKTGSVGASRLPLTTILPTSGSGAIMTRRNTLNFVHDVDRHMFWVTQISRSENNLGGSSQRSPFFTNLDVASTDIQVLRRSSNNDLLGIYKATFAGWYVVELGFRLDPAWTAGYSFAPLLYRSENLRTLTNTATGSVSYTPSDTGSGTGQNLEPYKIGSDSSLSSNPGARYAQSTWVIYLPANGAVAAGYDARYGALGTVDAPIDADASGIETYFSIAALNKTAA